MRARYYDPAIGRFISEDPGRDGANWYAYCNDNPVNNVDTTGKWVVPAVIAIFLQFAGAAIGAAVGFVAGYNWFNDTFVTPSDDNYKQISVTPGQAGAYGLVGGAVSALLRGAQWGRGIGVVPLVSACGVGIAVGLILGFEAGVIAAELDYIDSIGR